MWAYSEDWGRSKISQHITSASWITTFKLASDENKEKRQRAESTDDGVSRINNEMDRIVHCLKGNNFYDISINKGKPI